MTKLFKSIARFSKEESGAAMVEYAVALLVVTGIGIGAMATIGADAGALVGDACSTLQTSVVAQGNTAGGSC